MRPIDNVLSKFPYAKKQPNGWYQDKCPSHDDRHASFGFREDEQGNVQLKCHAGCLRGNILRAVGLQTSDLYVHESNGNGIKPYSKETIYEYTDEIGRVIFQAIRVEPGKNGKAKDFYQRQPIRDGMNLEGRRVSRDGKWVYDTQDCRRYLYRLPRITEAVKKDELIWIPEGEKDVHTLEKLGLYATTNIGGSDQEWTQLYGKTLRGARLAILWDNDDAGRKRRDYLREFLGKYAGSLRVVDLPVTREKADVTDWIQSGGSRSELEELYEGAPELIQRAPIGDLKYTADHLGNAYRCRDRHGDKMRHCALWDSWLVWDGRRWRMDDNKEAIRLAIEAAESIPEEAQNLSKEQFAELMKHAASSRFSAGINGTLNLLSALNGIAVRPDVFDADPWLMNCLNGTLDLRTGELLKHNPQNLITKLAPVEYEPEAYHPLWDDLLEKITGGDSEVAYYLQKAAGYSLTGSTAEEKVFVLVSEGGGGKTSFLEAIAAAMGDYATSAEQGTFLAKKAGSSGHSEDVAALAGARLVISSEIGKGRIAEELLKRMTGGDTMRASRKHGHSFTFRPQFTLWLCANTAPNADDADSGVWRRLRKVPWTPIPKEARDPRVKEILLNPAIAGPAILAWAVTGCLMWQKDGLGDPPSVAQETEEYRQSNDPLSQFIDDCCSIGPWQWVNAGSLREAYEAWCREQGYKPIGGKDWGDKLRANGFQSDRKGGNRVWAGIGLKTDAATGEDDKQRIVKDSFDYDR